MRAGSAPAGQAREPAASAPWGTLIVVAAGLFLAVVSTTVVSVALPTIGRDLGASATDLEWIVDAYVLVYASLLVTGGVAGDRLGRKGTYLAGVAVFGLGSLAAGLAPGTGLLIAARVLQGAGPALLIPGSLAIIRATFTDRRQRSAAVGLWSTSAGAAIAVGPALGGVLVEALSWRWVFLVNVPLAGAVVLLSARMIPRLARSGGGDAFDWPGAVLSVAAIGLLAFGVIEGQSQGWTALPVSTAFLLGIGALTAFVLAERRRPGPLVDVALFGRPAFAAANLAGLAVFFAFVGAIVYLSAYFQQAQGRSPVAAGLAVGIIGIAYAVAATWSGRLVGRFGERWPLLAGLVAAGLATLVLGRLSPATSLASIWWNFVLLGGGAGLCGTPMTTLALAAVDVRRAGMASAVLNACRQIGQVLGVAVLGALVYASLPGGTAGGRLDAAGRALFVAGLRHALLVAGAVLLATAVVIAPLLLRAPRVLAGGRARSRATG
jgi:DHA2 family methylenomycin A resistance protein-like MFS transporter